MKKGISLTALLLAIAVSFILISSIIVSYNNITEKAIKSNFAKEIYHIETLVEEYEFKKGEYPVLNNITFDISSINEKSQFVGCSGYSSNNITLSKIDLKKINISELNYGTEDSTNDIYVYSKETKKVYYLKGRVIAGNTYYTLTNELREYIGVNSL